MRKCHSKTKMVSFRLAPDEYAEFCEVCHARGLESLSELARITIQSLIQMEQVAEPVAHQLSALKECIRMLTRDIDRLKKHVDSPATDAELAQN